jgi:hypothetical protein
VETLMKKAYIALYTFEPEPDTFSLHERRIEAADMNEAWRVASGDLPPDWIEPKETLASIHLQGLPS